MKMGALSGADKHNERKNENYSNKDIDQERTKDNYHLIKPQKGYKTEFDRIREEENLKGNLRLTGEKQSNVACEFLITSDNDFFKNIGAERTKEFFTDSLDFIKNKVGEKHIISAVVHLDETTPHMHITYIPVAEKANKKGVVNKRINCSEFWKGFNSYGILQDDFYKHCIAKGYNLERGEIGSRAEHLEVAEYKAKSAIERAEQAQGKVEALESKIEPLQAKLESLEGAELDTSHINALAPQKTLIGAIKGISLEDIENLKKTAVKGAEWKWRAIQAEGLNTKLENMLNNIKCELDNAENENSKLRDEVNDFKFSFLQIKNILDRIPKKIIESAMEQIKSENNYSKRMREDDEWDR